jgi:lipopolysaccharide O-acetyltransferase
MLSCKIRTKILIPSARIVRFPIDIRGKKHIDFGKNLTTGRHCRIEAFPFGCEDGILIKFGNDCQINDYCHISAMQSVIIGDGTLLAGHIYISDNSHGKYKGHIQSSPMEKPIDREYYISPVVIGKNVWIGEHVVIMPGVQVGDGVIIGANSVVTKSIPANSIAVGIPAKVIKHFNYETKMWNNIV